MFPEVVKFIYSSTDGQLKAFQVKSNALTGDVAISKDVSDIADALKNRLGLKTTQTALARKLAYASTRRHYKDNTTMMEDISAGKTRRPASSYIKK
ncbi:hypothetical protein [Streptococcus suis]|uniref:hypothetical protein n=1 Tax=Streptococcus suis TaxID=1307 RepID=UPI00300FE66E